jgi:hypothetical protein
MVAPVCLPGPRRGSRGWGQSVVVEQLSGGSDPWKKRPGRDGHGELSLYEDGVRRQCVCPYIRSSKDVN